MSHSLSSHDLIHKGFARVGVELLDMKVDLLGDIAEVLRKNKFGHHFDEYRNTSIYNNNEEKKVTKTLTEVFSH